MKDLNETIEAVLSGTQSASAGTESLDEKYAKSMGFTNCEKAIQALALYLHPTSNLARSISASSDNVSKEFKKMKKHMDAIKVIWSEVEYTIGMNESVQESTSTVGDVKARHEQLKKTPIAKLRNQLGIMNRVVNVKEYDKAGAISDILRGEFGNKLVAKTFGLDK